MHRSEPASDNHYTSRQIWPTTNENNQGNWRTCLIVKYLKSKYSQEPLSIRSLWSIGKWIEGLDNFDKRFRPISAHTALSKVFEKITSAQLSSYFTFMFSKSWRRYQMETFSALLAICTGNSPITGGFPAQRPVTRGLDVFFNLRVNKLLSKQSRGWWFETLSRPLWRHCNVFPVYGLHSTKTLFSTWSDWRLQTIYWH